MSIRLTWRGTRDQMARADTALSEVLDPPADAVSLVKDEDAEADGDTGWALHAYLADAPDDGAVARALAALDLDLGEPAREDLDEDHDWVADALSGLGVVTAGPFTVYGSHDADRVADAPGHKIMVEANRAFGTGHHPTTAGCLEMLGGIADALPARVLDLGTGSGLLSIAARRLWPHAEVLATDVDAPSVAIAEENAELNGAQGIACRVADGVDDDVRAAGPFDLIVANILAEPLIDLAPAIEGVLTRDGRVMLAGLLERQAESVAVAYVAAGLHIVSRSGTSWPILLLERHGPA